MSDSVLLFCLSPLQLIIIVVQSFSVSQALNINRKMPVDIQKVLVCDAVDPSCVDLLKSNGISVDYKLKLPKDVLVEEAKVINYSKLQQNDEHFTIFMLNRQKIVQIYSLTSLSIA